MAIFKRTPKDDKKGPAQLTPWERYQRQAEQNETKSKKRRLTWFGKTLRIGDKLPKLKTQRRRLVAKRAALLISLFLIGILIALYFISPLSHVQRVKVSGTDGLTATQVTQATKIQPGVSIWAVIGHDRQISRQAKQRNPQVGKVTTKLVGLNQVNVKIDEIRVAGYLVKGNQYQRVLENGLILKSTYSQPGGGAPIYANFKGGARLEKMIAQYAKLPSTVKHAISEIKFAPAQSNPQRVHLYMNDGNEVYATIDTFANKMTYYPSIAAKMKAKGVINLEVGAYSYPFKN